MTTSARSALSVLALAGLLAVAGCSGDDEPTAVVSPDAPVVQPGKPGEPNQTLTGTAVAPRPTAEPVASDISFMQDMIVHHAQAIAMVTVAEDHLSDPEVKALALRIRDEQKPEIGAMEGWLRTRDHDVPPQATNPLLADHGSHHSGMAGMATEAQLAALDKARGVDADRMWLELMIAHHQGAIQMVMDRHATGVDEIVGQLSDEITVTQNAQINIMKDMEERLA